MKVSLTNNPSEIDDQVISDGLNRYNRQFSSGIFEPLSVYSRTKDDVIIGGLIGVSYGNWLHVSEFWVEEAFRGRSVGTRILIAAEQEAIRRDCIGVTLDTYNFQSLEFYLKRGYLEFGSLSGYGGKYSRHYLQKLFATD